MTPRSDEALSSLRALHCVAYVQVPGARFTKNRTITFPSYDNYHDSFAFQKNHYDENDKKLVVDLRRQNRCHRVLRRRKNHLRTLRSS